MTNSVLTLSAPAKLNLFLHITGRRNDGYHNLQTLFQILDYGDSISYREISQPLIELSTPMPGIRNEDNLIVRAANTLRIHALESGRMSKPKGVSISVEKKLPMGGGLGGGSSNAATTLLALNEIWRLGYNDDELAKMGLKLGADVPVFVIGHTAWGEGVGERLTPVELTPRFYTVIHPGRHICTAEIFSHKQLTRDTPERKIAPALEGELETFRNDCEAVVSELYPEVRSALTWLNQFGQARLTGTGACVFACFADRETAENALSHIPTAYKGFVAKGVNKSPAIYL